jgi:demethylmenaquinone methyltransferase/2-methoxy-6-polyprenyl-1,4-benzoquinol methylase
VESERGRHAVQLFGGIAAEYERMGAVLSLGQDRRWRREMVSRVLAAPNRWVLDVATGTGLVARKLAAQSGARVAALDRSEPMLRAGLAATRRAVDGRVSPLLGRAERLPFADGTFDAVTFTYLLRYVDDPSTTLVELVRVLRPGGVLACVEFHVPRHPIVHAIWWAYTRLLMPWIARLASPAWQHAGRFLGPSISELYERYPLAEQVRMWQDAGIRHVRTRVMSLGVGVVIRGVKDGSARGGVTEASTRGGEGSIGS